MQRLTRVSMIAVLCMVPSSCGSPENFAIDPYHGVSHQRYDNCLLPFVDNTLHECIFVVSDSESMMQNSESNDDGTHMYTFLVADLSGFVRAQCRISAPSKKWFFVQVCGPTQGYMTYRVLVRPPPKDIP